MGQVYQGRRRANVQRTRKLVNSVIDRDAAEEAVLADDAPWGLYFANSPEVVAALATVAARCAVTLLESE